MLCYYKTLMTNMSSNIFNCCVYRAAANTLKDFTWTHCASCLFNTAWFICMLLLIGLIFLTHPTNKKKVSQTPLHTVSRKHVVQPGNRGKTLGTGVSLNVPLLKGEIDKLGAQPWRCPQPDDSSRFSIMI